MDPELSEHLAHMPFDCARAEEQPRADVRVRNTLAGESRDLPLLGCQIVPRLHGSLADLLARRKKLCMRAIRERLHPDRDEHLVSRAQLLARVDSATLAAQPLAVEQVPTRELGPEAGAGEQFDRVSVQAVSDLPFADECAGASENSLR